MRWSELAAQTLREAAHFYRDLGEQNPDSMDLLLQAAVRYELLAARLDHDPTGSVPADETELRRGLIPNFPPL